MLTEKTQQEKYQPRLKEIVKNCYKPPHKPGVVLFASLLAATGQQRAAILRLETKDIDLRNRVITFTLKNLKHLGRYSKQTYTEKFPFENFHELFANELVKDLEIICKTKRPNKTLLFYSLINEYKYDHSYASSILLHLKSLFIEKLSEKPEENINSFASFLAKKRTFKSFSQKISQKIDPDNVEHITSFFNNAKHSFDAINKSWETISKKGEKLELILENFEERQQEKEKLTIKTPFEELNKLLHGGFAEQSVVLIGARTNIGKTTFASNLALHFAQHELQKNQQVYYWSIEDDEDSICKKFLMRFLRGQNTPDNRKLAHEKLSKLPIVVCDAKEIEILKIISEIKKEQTNKTQHNYYYRLCERAYLFGRRL